VRVGGFYMNQRPNSKDWALASAYPTSSMFESFFQFNVGYHLIAQAATERRCFCVHSTSLSTGSLSFIFVPLPLDDTSPAVSVLVFGTILGGEDDLHFHLVFLDQIRRPIVNALNTLLTLQNNMTLMRKMEYLRTENEVLKQRNRFERALINVITSSGPTITDPNVGICVTDQMGVIQYFSTGAQALLGYTTTELVGRYTSTMFHETNDLVIRTKELEQESGQKIAAGFQVIVDPILRTGNEYSHDFVFLRKDGNTIDVHLTVRPLYDEEDRSLVGFLEIAKPKEKRIQNY